jgi:hypothetical protein
MLLSADGQSVDIGSWVGKPHFVVGERFSVGDFDRIDLAMWVQTHIEN